MRILATSAVEETLGGGGFELLPVFLDHGDRSRAKQNVEDALARHPDLVMALGAVVLQRPLHRQRGGGPPAAPASP